MADPTMLAAKKKLKFKDFARFAWPGRGKPADYIPV
jgi:hypothetical protein